MIDQFDRVPFPVSCHTKHIGPGSTFVAITGKHLNGVDYVAQAVAQGATNIVISDQTMLDTATVQFLAHHRVTIMSVPQPRLALAQLSAQASGHAHKKLSLIGITGTKGKTTCAFLLFHLLRSAGYNAALTSTVYNQIGTIRYPANLTTPQPDYLHQFFRLCVQKHVTHVVMELAAQAFSLHRTHGLQFDAGLFTNFSQEHGEFYKTEDEYFHAKTLLIQQLKLGAPFIINADDSSFSRLQQYYPSAITYGQNPNTAHAYITDYCTNPISVHITYENQLYRLRSKLRGTFNTYNLAGVVTLAHNIPLSQHHIEQGITTFAGVPGRLQEHQLPNGARAFIDYAHNPSSYKSVLPVLRSMTTHLIVLFGCGGERDRKKRPIMGGIAAEYADYIIITDDNPRTESPQQIQSDILSGINQDYRNTKTCYIADRQQAILHAYTKSQAQTIIALFGKGPDEYQIIGKEKLFFSEQEILKSLS